MQTNFPKYVLVVDDSRVQREFAVDLCRRMWGCEIYQADDGEQAIALLARFPHIELVILDLEMPRMDGVQALHEMARLGMEPAVIVASGRESMLLTVVENMGKSLGISLLGVMQKPISNEQLATSVKRVSALKLRQAASTDKVLVVPELTERDVIVGLRKQQFQAYFQPKVSLLDGNLTGVEALIRWKHPRHGLLMPGQFIDLIERSDSMSDVTLAMLDMSLQQCKLWHAAGLHISVSINLSARSLADAQLANAIIERIAASGVEPRLIMLEITESALMTDLAITYGTLARFRLKGIGLSIDDYGTGFSSLLQLSRIPCSELKVDRAFVHGASDNLNLQVLLESAIDTARRLSLKVVAEGVETHKDWMLLRHLECDEAQGYFIARPMPGSALSLWWSANRIRLQKLVKQVGLLHRILGVV
ncbi:EAL domain-containing protein [Pseudomonas fluorescens]|uniref:Uncharacterized protein n=1 Tax=Pseudomonas fluorescens TaxID=294 RepID=A0A423LKG8_PSEFL|nr:EAL domain-containing response regulator [Pseudomonas fluorescens]RON68804.1 hypothetical protein BK671_10705 [Pseudomonas fluorescens]